MATGTSTTNSSKQPDSLADVEDTRSGELTDIEAIRKRLARILFPNSESSRISTYTHDSAAAMACVRFIESGLLEVQDAYLSQALTFLDIASSPTLTRHDILRFACSVAEIVRDSTDGQRQRSIHDIVRALLERAALDEDKLDPSLFNAMQQAVFASIGRFAALFTPYPMPASGVLEICLAGTNSGRRVQQAFKSGGRPIVPFLRSIGVSVPLDPDTRPVYDLALPVTILNFSSLGLKVEGKRTRIGWVDDLTAHLDFDEATRTIFLFRFPSICALNLVRSGERSFFDLIMDDYCQATELSDAANAQLHREVLLSFRLLFGQVKAARRIFHRIEKERAMKNKIHDPLLEQLCGSKKPLGTIMSEEAVHEKDVYNGVDFPCLGARLARILKYVELHKTTKIRDRWRDRTNRAEWMAFWTLLLIGVLSIVLSVVQIALAAAQLDAQIKSIPK